MKQLIYYSKPSKGLDPSVLQDIYLKALENNALYDITGMLISDGQYFLQCIEGEAKMIDQLLSNLEEDSRHDNFEIIDTINIEKRDFSDWDMGYIGDINDINHALDELSLHKPFTPSTLSYVEAKQLLKNLSHLL
jgi:hypothetical protein